MKKGYLAIYLIVMIFGYWFEYEILDGNMPFWLFIILNLVVGYHWMHLYDYDKELMEAEKNIKPIVAIWVFIMCISIIGVVCNIVNKNWVLLIIFILLTIISIAILCRNFDEPTEE